MWEMPKTLKILKAQKVLKAGPEMTIVCTMIFTGAWTEMIL